MFRRVRFWLIIAPPHWIAFRNMCLKMSYDGEYHCCLSKGHAGNCHGDVSFERQYRAAEDFYQTEKRKVEARAV